MNSHPPNEFKMKVKEAAASPHRILSLNHIPHASTSPFSSDKAYSTPTLELTLCSCKYFQILSQKVCKLIRLDVHNN